MVSKPDLMAEHATSPGFEPESKMTDYSDHFSAVDDLGMVLQLVQSPVPILMCFLADWSGSSHLLNTVVQDLLEAYHEKILFYYVDTDTQKDIVSYFGIGTVPTLLFFQGGEVKDYHTGVISNKLLAEKLDKLME